MVVISVSVMTQCVMHLGPSLAVFRLAIAALHAVKWLENFHVNSPRLWCHSA